MQELTVILGIILGITLILNFQAFLDVKTAIEIVNDMGLGYNLGNSFDSYNISIKIDNPDDQITLLGNPIPTKNLISNIKKSGFKTIRFPVTWINFIDEYGNVNPEWMKRVKEVVNWIISKNLYCIINIHNDGEEGNWLYYRLNAKEKYINLWSQIAEEFKDINDHLIFESMDNPVYYFDYFDDYSEYDVLLNLTQAFVDTIRNSGGYNKERLLIISGMNANFVDTCSEYYKMPIDPYNKLAISIHYFNPKMFTLEVNNLFSDEITWGNEDDYRNIIRNFDTMKEYYVDKNIPVILGEVGVVTEYSRELSSIHQYLYTIFSLSSDYNGIMACLWDTSNKNIGDMNYFNRENNEWYDKTIQDFIYKISKKKYIYSSDFYHMTTSETLITVSELGDYYINIRKNKPLLLIINVLATSEDYDFSITCFNEDGPSPDVIFDLENRKKQYDGTRIYTINITDEDCSKGVSIINWTNDILFFNNITVQYNESFFSFDYTSYHEEILKEIS